MSKRRSSFESDPANVTTDKLELREEELVAHTDLRRVGDVQIRTRLEDVPARMEVDAVREEVVVEHEPVGEVVSERAQPWEEGDVLVVPIYEEQLVVSKRLVLRERIRVRRLRTTERHLFEDTLQRERLVVDDQNGTGLVRQRYPTASTEPTEASTGLLETLGRRVLE